MLHFLSDDKESRPEHVKRNLDILPFSNIRHHALVPVDTCPHCPMNQPELFGGVKDEFTGENILVYGTRICEFVRRRILWASTPLFADGGRQLDQSFKFAVCDNQS